MPLMPRVSKKTQKIANAILGVTSNMQKKSEHQKAIDRRIAYQYTRRSK